MMGRGLILRLVYRTRYLYSITVISGIVPLVDDERLPLCPTRPRAQDFIRFAGFDALVYTRMYLLAGRILCVIALYAWPVILPINLTGGFEDTDNKLSLMSMSNVAIKSNLL